MTGKIVGPAPTPQGLKIRGVLRVYYSSQHQKFVAAAWPKGNGGDTPKRAASRAAFTAATQIIKNSGAQEYDAADAWVKNSPYLRRDALMAGARGSLFDIITRDGAYWGSVFMADFSIQTLLDSISSEEGALLVRTPDGWVALLGGEAGQVVTLNATTGLPDWETPQAGIPSGQVAVIIGAGAPSDLQPAGQPYSRNDEAGFYVSTPTASGGAPEFVQQASNATHGTPGGVTFGAAPTPGNLILAWCGSAGDVSGDVDTAHWTLIEHGGSGDCGLLAYRYAVSGDTATIPDICSSGSVFNFVSAVEVGNVTGDWATDFDRVISDYEITGASSITTKSDTTDSADQLVLMVVGQYDATHDFTPPSSDWTAEEVKLWAANYGATMALAQTPSGAGASVQATFGAEASPGNRIWYIEVLLNGGSGGLDAGWTKIGP